MHLQDLSISAGISLITLGLAMPTLVSADWNIVGFQQHFCTDTNHEDSWYSWQGSDSDCHNFGDENRNCVFTKTEGGVFSGDQCNSDTPSSIQSVLYEMGNDNNGAGCRFYYQQDCRGDSDRVTRLDEVSFCYEFSAEISSFRCI